MTTHEMPNMLIKTTKIWQFLQYLDSLIEEDEVHSTTIVNDFFERSGFSLDDMKTNGMLPFVQLKTTLSLLLSTLCFARWRVENSDWEAGMKKPSDYDLECEGPNDPDIFQVIRTIRNAAAHGFDDDDFLTFPPDKVVSFKTTYRRISKVTFCSEEGFLDFVRDYLRVIQRMCCGNRCNTKKQSGKLSSFNL